MTEIQVNEEKEVEVNEDDLSQLLEFQVPSDRALLALQAVGGSGVDAALNWLSENPLSAEQESERPKLSPEEALKKAQDLQKRLRDARLLREKEETLQREKQRIQSTKLLMEQKRQFEEAERQRAIEQQLRQRDELEQAKQKQKALLAKEYEERFGKKYEESVPDIKTKSARDQCLYHIQELKKLMKEGASSEEKIKVCVKTLRAYCANAHEHPTDPKYWTIKKSNNAFQQRISGIEPAIALLKAAGFVDKGDCFQIVTVVPDQFTLAECVKFLDFILR